MSFINKIAISLKQQLKPQPKFDAIPMAINNASVTDNIEVSAKSTDKWFRFGLDDRGFDFLETLAQKSAIHGAILNTKALMISGDGYLLNEAKTNQESELIYKSLPPDEKAKVDFVLENPYGKITYQDFTDILAQNLALNGAFAYIVSWNQDFTAIASYREVNVKYLRAAVPSDGGEIEAYYYYEGDFKTAKEKSILKYYVYNQQDTSHYDQIVYFKTGLNPIYGIPSYAGALDWITIDIEMGIFHKANIQNGMNPGLHFKFYTVPESEEEKQIINNQIKKNWLGPIKTARFVSTFSPSKDLATDIAPIEASGLDKQLLNLTELCDRKILSGHQITSPLLAGISVSGQIGGNVELPTAFELWNNMIIAKFRQQIDNSLNTHIWEVNTNSKVYINSFNPLEGIKTNQEKLT